MRNFQQHFQDVTAVFTAKQLMSNLKIEIMKTLKTIMMIMILSFFATSCTDLELDELQENSTEIVTGNPSDDSGSDQISPDNGDSNTNGDNSGSNGTTSNDTGDDDGDGGSGSGKGN